MSVQHCVLSDENTDCEAGILLDDLEEDPAEIERRLQKDRIIRFKIPASNRESGISSWRTACFDVLELYDVIYQNANARLPYGNFCTFTPEQRQLIENRVRKQFPEHYREEPRESILEEMKAQEANLPYNEVQDIQGQLERLQFQLDDVDSKLSESTRAKSKQFINERRQILDEMKELEIHLQDAREVETVRRQLPNMCERAIYAVLSSVKDVQDYIKGEEYKQALQLTEQILESIETSGNIVAETCKRDNPEAVQLLNNSEEFLLELQSTLESYVRPRTTRRSALQKSVTVSIQQLRNISRGLANLQNQATAFILPVLRRIFNLKPNVYTEKFLPNFCERQLFWTQEFTSVVASFLQQDDYKNAKAAAEETLEALEESQGKSTKYQFPYWYCKGRRRELLQEIEAILQSIVKSSAQKLQRSDFAADIFKLRQETLLALKPVIDRVFLKDLKI